MTNLFDGKPVPVYGDGLQVREMLYVEDHCAAIDRVLHDGGPGEIYNVGAEHEVANIETTRRLLALTGRDESFVTYVTDRPGHDRRYALDCSKLRALGWSRTVSFDDGLRLTVDWFRDNRSWWEAITSGEAYVDYAARNYARR